MTTIPQRTAPATTPPDDKPVAQWGFPLLYLGWAYLFWSPIVGSATSVWSGRNLVLFLIGGASPLLAAITLSWYSGGAARVRDLGRRTVDVRRITPRWWLVILLFWPAFNLSMGGLAIATGISDDPFDVAWDVATRPQMLLFLLTLSFVFPAAEEIGLRGYYLDRLQERFSIIAAALISGATWAVWHAPFVQFPGYYDDTAFNPELWWWMPRIVLDTVILVWVYTNTRRSILAVIVFHAMMNLTGELLGIAPDLHPFFSLGSAAVAATIMLRWHRSGPGPDVRLRRIP